MSSKKLNYILAGLLVLSFAYILFDKFYLDRRAAETKQLPNVSDTLKGKKTIAVLPFVNLSPDPTQEYFVDGLSEEILNNFAQIPELSVIARTASFSFKGSNKSIQEIASILGVEYILEGSVRKAGNALRITAQLIRAADNETLWTNTYDRELKDIFAVQEDIATAVASKLKATLGISKSLKQLGGTDKMEAYELYLVAKEQQSPDNLINALKSIDTAIALDPKFVLAWAVKANIHNELAIHGPANSTATEQNEALSAALKAIELEPNLASGYVALGRLRDSKGDWIEAGSAHRKALELQTEPLSGDEMLISEHYFAVGYFKKAHELFEEILHNDPLQPVSRANYMLILGILGDTQLAEKEYEHGKALYGDQWSMGDEFITAIRLGSTDHISRDKIVYSNLIWDAAKNYLDSPKEGLLELRRIYTDNKNLSYLENSFISLWAAYFGDHDLSMDAMEKSTSIDASGIFKIWLPVMKEVRQTTRFKTLVNKIGLVNYWNRFGWPDMCHKLDNGDFECD